MNSRSDDANTDCLSEFLFEEYAMGRLGGEGCKNVEAHLRRCPRCAAQATDIRREAELVAELMRSIPLEAQGECIEEETLALYLDQGLDPGERESAEGHLSTCRRCREKLIRLNRELNALLDDEESKAPLRFHREEVQASVSPFAPTRDGQDPALPVAGRPAALGSLILAGAGVVLSTFAALTTSTYSAHLLFFALGCAGYIGYRWLLTAAGMGAAKSGQRGAVSPRDGLILAALALFAAAWFLPSGTIWCLSASFAMYLAWLFIRLHSGLAQQRKGPAGAHRDEQTEQVRERPAATETRFGRGPRS